MRLPVTILLIGGGLLVIMGQLIYAPVPEQLRPFVLALVGVGLVAFVVGGRLVARPTLPDTLLRAVRRVSDKLRITPSQLLLLILAPCFGLMAVLAAGDVLKALNFPVYLAAWILSILCVLLGTMAPKNPPRLELDIKELVLVATLFLVAFLLRAWAVETLPATLSGDEASAGLTSALFARGESDNVLTVGWFSFPSLYFAIQGVGIFLLDQTVAGLRITSALAGALTVFAVYFLARTLFDRLTAVLAAVLLTTFHYHIHFSRIGLNNIWDGLFGALVFAGLWYGWKHERRAGFVLCGLALGFGLYFYVSIRVFPVLLLIFALAAFLVDREKFKRLFPDFFLAGLVAFVIIIPLIFFFARHPAEFSAPLQRVTIFDGWLDAMVIREQSPAWKIIWDQIVNTALGFTHLPLRHWYNPGVPLLLPGAAALFLLGLLWMVTNLNLRYLLLILPLLSMIILGGLSQDAPASQRYVIAAPFVVILVALPLAKVTQWLQEYWPRAKYVILAGTAVIILWLAAADLRYYFFDVYDEYVLGGYNTQVATDIAHHLAEQEPAPQVYFFGFPRMGYFSLSTLPYLAADVQAEDILSPLTEAPRWQLTGPTEFIFLPERAEERFLIQQQFPGGIYQEYRDDSGAVLYSIYSVNPGQ